jgi:ribosome biogenesis protein ERB1
VTRLNQTLTGSSTGADSTADATSLKATSTTTKSQAKDDLNVRQYDKNLNDSDDSSDEEVLIRTGNVPMKWYELYDHQGYDVKGQKVGKPEGEGQDELDKFIERQGDKHWWMKIRDTLNNKNVKLSKADMELIQRVRSGKYADADIDPYDTYIEFEHKEMIHPMQSGNEPKRRFQPSKWERLKVNKLVQALKKGWLKTLAEKEKEREESQKEKVWDIWQDDSVVTWRPRKMPKAIAAPKRDLPLNVESYNPPEEYLLDDKEKEEFEKLDREDRPLNFLPQKFEALRKVPLYQDLIREHFERCLDLYLCPRVLKKKVNVSDPQQLIPELP